jgi:3-oxoadipate enol-lactonase
LLARVKKMERDGLSTVLATLEIGYTAELRGDAKRFASFRARWLGGDPVSYGAIYRMLIATDLAPELPRIRCPVLLTAGALDRVRPPHLVEPVAQAIAGARYVTLQAAHYAPVQAPELYAKTVGKFLAEVGL